MRKLVFPGAPMLVAPSVVVYLAGTFLLGPGLTSNLLLKDRRARSESWFGGILSPTWSFAGVVTIAIVAALYLLLLDPIRRNDARFEHMITRASLQLHCAMGSSSPEPELRLRARAGAALRQTGQNFATRRA